MNTAMFIMQCKAGHDELKMILMLQQAVTRQKGLSKCMFSFPPDNQDRCGVWTSDRQYRKPRALKKWDAIIFIPIKPAVCSAALIPLNKGVSIAGAGYLCLPDARLIRCRQP